MVDVLPTPMFPIFALFVLTGAASSTEFDAAYGAVGFIIGFVWGVWFQSRESHNE